VMRPHDTGLAANVVTGHNQWKRPCQKNLFPLWGIDLGEVWGMEYRARTSWKTDVIRQAVRLELN
jgi:hypothetical protein